MNLKQYLETQKKRVDDFMETYFNGTEAPSQALIESMRYSLLAGGKRVRPVLVLAAYEACVSPEKRNSVLDKASLAIATALEMIHTYSLIHDDLPAMDNDDLRRGRPTNHKVYGEATAILAGDSLLTEAFSLIAKNPGVDAGILLQVIADIAKGSGAFGMAGGQALDLESEKRKISAAELEKLHRHKTGCLIEVSVTSGARLAGASPQVLQAIQIYGEKIGLAFQIADDVLDVEGGAQEMGKATGGDARKEKSTYPSTLGLEKSKTMAATLSDEAVNALKILDTRADPLREIARYIVFRKN